jgi:Flp pilus assembly protein TadD
MAAKEMEKAIIVFELCADAFPASSNAFDSLGEAYMIAGQRESAARNLRKSLELDPTNEHAAKMLEQLQAN